MALGQTPPQQRLHDACNRYEEAIAGIPDDDFDALATLLEQATPTTTEEA